MSKPTESPAFAGLRQLFDSRIAVLDGAMGTMIQGLGLGEADFRGDRFRDHPRELKGNNDLLSLTRPEAIQGIHAAYFAAGADVVETNTFNSTAVSQADYGLESAVPDINAAAVAAAKRAAAAAVAADPTRPRFVVGAVGPLNRTLSMSPDVNRPDYRAVTWDDVVGAYLEQCRSLVAAGADALLIETIFDTLNAKAALFATELLFDETGVRVPVMVSVTITDAAGRTLSGQTVAAFYTSIAHARPFSVGINCALGARQMRPHVEELSAIASCYVTCHPNAGLPNAFGGYDESPADMASVLREFAANGWINMVGGCCGTTPAHIAAIAEAVRGFPARRPAAVPPELRLSGLERLVIA
jgi:5-methyltetrahydrofolate--homocysteine methyltransferase